MKAPLTLRQLATEWKPGPSRIARLYRTATNHFDVMLGRPSTVDDLTRENIAEFMRHVQRGARHEHHVIEVTKRIFTLWRLAYERKLTAESAPSPRPQLHPTIKGAVVWPKPRSGRYLADPCKWKGTDPASVPLSVALQKVIAKLPRRRATNTRSYVRKFIRLMGDLPVGSVDADCLRRLRAVAIENGLSKQYLCAIRHDVQMVIAEFTERRMRFPRWHQNGAPKRMDPTEIDGTLLSYYCCLYRPLRLGGMSPRTDEHFRKMIDCFEKLLGRAPTIDDLDDMVVSRALEKYASEPKANGKPRSRSTVNKLYWGVLALWNFLDKRRLTSAGPTIRPYVEPERTPRAWLSDELNRLWKACDEQPGMVGDIPACDFWSAFVRLAWCSGERKSALLGIEWQDVDLHTGFATFVASVRKGKRKPNSVKLSPDTIERLRKIQRTEGPVFPFPFHEATFYNRFVQILLSANLPSNRWTKTHCLRRSVASHYEAAGGNATALLLHSSRRVTEAYLDPRIVVKPQGVDLLFMPSGEPTGCQAGK